MCVYLFGVKSECRTIVHLCDNYSLVSPYLFILNSIHMYSNNQLVKSIIIGLIVTIIVLIINYITK